MRRFMLCLSLAAIGVVAAFGATAEDRTIGVETQKSLGLTVYNGGTAMVRDVRAIVLEKGVNRLAFEEVSAQIQPETASLKALGKASFSLIEQNFDFDLLTPDKLTEKAVGGPVELVRVNPATGQETREQGHVLSANGGVVLQLGERIEALGSQGLNGRLVFNKIPSNLRARPTLSMTLDTKARAETEIELAYLSGGLTWAADYVGRLSDDETRLDLQAWVTMTNSSGATFRDATLQLVAGEVNRVRAAPLAMRGVAAMVVRSPETDAAREELGDYHLYTAPHRTTIANMQTKQVGLFSATDVKAKKALRGAWDIAYNYRSGVEEETIPAVVYLSIANTEAAGLGLPMPKGVVRVYKSDSSGRSQFIGEDRIDHTPKNETIDLHLGESFDVTLKAKQLSYRRYDSVSRELGDVTVHETRHQVSARNAKAKVQEVGLSLMVEPIVTVSDANLPYERPMSHVLEWTLSIPAEGETLLTFSTQYETPRKGR